MCKYCEKMEGIWLRKKNVYYKTIGQYTGDEKVLAAIMDLENKSFFKNESYLTVDVDYNKEKRGNWLDVKINYCPFCGKSLKRKTLSNTIKAIIEYKWGMIHDKEVEKGVAICSKCGKKINKKEKVITRESKKIYCEKCSIKEEIKKMKEIIFWFSNHHIKNYWLDYAIDYWGKRFSYDTVFGYNRVQDWIKIGDLKILFKVDLGSRSYIGWGNTNQYWVEELFDNNFEEFFRTILKEEI